MLGLQICPPESTSLASEILTIMILFRNYNVTIFIKSASILKILHKIYFRRKRIILQILDKNFPLIFMRNVDHFASWFISRLVLFSESWSYSFVKYFLGFVFESKKIKR